MVSLLVEVIRSSAILVLLSASVLSAFPPAPSYTLFGIVRDQVGQTLDVEGATLVLLKGTREVGRTPINSKLRIDQNYELKIRIDANRAPFPRPPSRPNGCFGGLPSEENS